MGANSKHIVIVLGCALLGACDVNIPEGKLKCDLDSECPSDWTCFEGACYRERPSDSAGMGDGGGTGMDAGGLPGGGGDSGAGGADAGTDAGFDAGVDTTGCDAFSTFYRDADGDGLGAMSMSLQACSVDTGYVSNGDDCDDLCTACTKADASEVCDGLDNECDGTVDDGALAFSARVSFDDLGPGEWTELVSTAEGAVLFTAVTLSPGVTGIKGQRFAADGTAQGDAVVIAGANPAGFYNFAADHLNGKIVLTWFETDGIKASVVKASDLTSLVAEKSIGSIANLKSPALDVAVSASASGGRALFAYAQGSEIKTAPYKLTDLAIEDSERILYLPTDPNQSLSSVTLTGAPCLSGFYAAVQDEGLRLLRVVPLGEAGAISGTHYETPIGAMLVFSALPSLHVEGGDCDTKPTRLVLAYAIDETLAPSVSADVHFSYLDIARTGSSDTITLLDGFNYEQAGWVLPAVRIFPSGFISINRALDVIGYDGRYLLTTLTASAESDKGLVEVREIKGTSIVATHEAKDIKPAAPLNVQLGVVGDKAWLGTSSWSNKDPAGLLRIGCN